ncbi:UNVERIFIED_ORG: hypothetical protein B2H98_08445 [Clostridium botulinum]|uniref:DUF3783 domain-containing protein n=1 Tax=Clostridium botulinum TaxID=1491 RepID=A0A6M0SSB7_CLOBO|nr:DUF3783 domain-containing protein [Clostridium botulinum]MBY6810331.1 DUF3783 domain-containing protein [Clostridium botulinum]MBY6823849.1 DUF3783 domain-containing protein [Clostridium botulinum]MBY6834398.1 DUF3783 domain-containing protein [Clostridium botulinum]MBY6972975.1 DUF3783 domain-containing protein [Clostridium botulinum]NFA43246.1 DUF3783 domain-containing protein [Clostridium botulinum]
MIPNIKCILAYGLEDSEINKIKQRYGKVIKINKDMGNVKIKDLISGLEQVEEPEDMIEEKMIIFNKFAEGQLKGAIKYIRGFTSDGVLAVTTPVSCNWSLKYLLEHLIEEREWHKAGQKGRE